MIAGSPMGIRGPRVKSNHAKPDLESKKAWRALFRAPQKHFCWLSV